ncbi:DUF134 domain-containing protein [Blastochloris sulfoviridis]|uniref:UPF0251 protein F1193_14695 n=1 Tax=Blastochloris sulfoviridis TaxID=50712 RepID=A0A5M6HNE6_9HYPH|nr:DUF134 domain-containing protein [Blastochloris sulfoviridis]KAA5597198.1 DUF134 domain-containing protein [Blastochloris sulfoviridis]
MSRPRKMRVIREAASIRVFKPQGIPLRELQDVVLTEDGMEALRLADAEGLEHAAAAELMGVSRPTFSRLLAEARTTVATALARGWAVRIEGGAVRRPEEDEIAATGCPMQGLRRRRGHCGRWRTPEGTTPAFAAIAAVEDAEDAEKVSPDRILPSSAARNTSGSPLSSNQQKDPPNDDR